MAMDFWEAQRRARSRTTLFVFLFVSMTLIVAVLVELGMRYFAGDSYAPPFPVAGAAFALITFGVAGFQYLNFGMSGGGYVAESLGAWKVSSTTTHPLERQLLNIVQEMALAASLPVPAVYILEANEINAFAAGLTQKDAAITVTTGTLKRLNRDELQGVVAHELGHVHNGDMQISMRLAAMVMGFFFIIFIGLRILQFSSLGRNRDEKREGNNPLVIAALIFMVAGAFTWLMGSILKSAVSREREYLADACAVQFTRNPQGIGNALRKIANTKTSDMPPQGAAYSHLYFDDRTALSGLFQTHPPLSKRIAAIEGRAYIPKEWNIPE